MDKSPRILFRRWQILILVCLAPVFALESASLASGQQHDIHLLVHQTASQSLTLIKPSDTDFEDTLDSYFPGLSQEDGYQQSIKPFLVIVRNDNYSPAVAYAITWTAKYTPGWARPLLAMFVDRPLMYGSARRSIPPAGIRLISPLFNVTPELYQANLYFAQSYPASGFPPTNELASVEVSVDGVVYRDGTFIGPNETRVLQRFVAARFAERDAALTALNFINSSNSPQLILAQQLQQSLNQEIQKDGRASQRTLLALYVGARDKSAQDLLRTLRNRGLDGLKTVLQNFVNRSEGAPNPSIFDKRYRALSDNDPRVFGDVP